MLSSEILVLILHRFFKPDRLVANDFIQCRKVAEHILEKLLGEGTAGSPGAGDTDPSSTTNNGTSVDQIELTCNDQVSLTYLIIKDSSQFTNLIFRY